MDDSLKKVKKLIALMRKEGVLTLKQGDIELSLSPLAIDPIQHSNTPDVPEAEPKPLYSGDDLLFWSSPDVFPEKADQ